MIDEVIRRAEVSRQTKNLNYYHALHLTLQTPFTTHDPPMPPHRRLRLSAYTVLGCRIHTRQPIRRLSLTLSLALARFPPSRMLPMLRDEWWGAGARAKGGVGKKRRVEREVRLRCFFFGIWLADADFGVDDLKVSLITTGEARHLILRKEMRIKNETEANWAQTVRGDEEDVVDYG